MAKPTIWWPLDKTVVTQPWGANPAFYNRYGQRGHNGIDFGHNPIGTPVFAADDGVIAFEGWGQNNSWMGAPAGVSVLIRHSWGHSGYAHLNTTTVNSGQSVRKGQQIGTIGTTGASTGPHLHFETFPPSPHFGNGFAGRVNPTSLVNIAARGSSTAPTPSPTTGQSGDEDMARNSGIYWPDGTNTYVYAVFNTESGFWHEFSNGQGRGSMPSAYNNALAGAMFTPSWAQVTKAHAGVIKSACAAVRKGS